MYRVMYMSTAVERFFDEQLEEILNKAIENNSKRNVTGLLVIKGRTFLQCLEGQEEDVKFIYEKILKDVRHKDIICLVEEESNERYFPNWSMGFKNIKNLTDIKSEKLRNFANEEEMNFSSDDISELFQEFVETN